MVATGGSLRVMFAIHEQRYGKRFMVRADESLTAFLDLERGRFALATNDRNGCLVIGPSTAEKLQLQSVLYFGFCY
jgi:hypothetical protein